MLWDWETPSSAYFGKQEPLPIDPGPVYSSSSKSTISVSVDSSPFIRPPALNPLPSDPPIGLKLGKRTYFEDISAAAAAVNPSPSSASSLPSALVKRARNPHQNAHTLRCQVEGCNLDLAAAKEYHRKHRVCESHSKSPRVVIAGMERRFCQQCSRFHDLTAFDDKKRSCRKRLSDHNARRRKQSPGTMHFGTGSLPSTFYDNRQQMNLLLNRAPLGHIRSSSGSTWEGSFDFKLAQMKGSWIKSTKGDSEGQLLLPANNTSNAFSTLRHDLDRILPFKGTTAEVLNQGPETSTVASTLNGAPDIRRALSLLSTDSWVSTEPGPTASLAQTMHTDQSSASQHAIHAGNSTSNCWQDDQPIAQHAQVFPFAMHNNGSQFQEFQLLKSPYETTFFDS